MTTKENRHRNGHSKTDLSPINKRSHFLNFNLNQNHKYSNVSSVQSFCKPNNAKYSELQQHLLGYTVTKNYNEKSLNKSSKDPILKTSKHSSLRKNVEEEAQKRWKNDKDDSKMNSSTLSLHIAAYENSIEGVPSESEEFSKNSQAFQTVLSKLHDHFEFPRQMKDNKHFNPEVQQFKTSQKLFSPNQGASASELHSFQMPRSFAQELEFIERISPVEFRIKKGFVPNMNVEGRFYVNSNLEKLMFEELQQACTKGGVGGFLPAVKQIGNVASLPAIVGNSIGLPDIHSGYGFAIGNIAAFDTSNPEAVVSPGGVGFDINCGVRLIRTNLMEKDVEPYKEQLAQSLFDHIPVGVGSRGIIPIKASDFEQCLQYGMDWSLREGYSWTEDKEHCEEYGRMLQADASKVSMRAKKRGLPQLGTLGAGNHYGEVQVVDEIFDKHAAAKMGIEEKGQVCVMIHCGSRGLGHQVATDSLVEMERAMARDGIFVNDRQLACARIQSTEGQNYLKGMAAAANFAWVNRSCMTFCVRQAFSRIFNSSPDDLDMHVIYDVSHNIAKFEEHWIDGRPKELCVHRKGSTRAFGPHHPLIPVDYQLTGQPVLIGGSMGTCSYILSGTQKGMNETFGTTCHGAGRAMSRSKSRRNILFEDVLENLKQKGISIRVASPKLVMEEAPESYKDVTDVVNTCHEAGISKLAVKLRPIAVIKG